MKAKVILLASVLLAGCQNTQDTSTLAEQRAQSLSSESQDEVIGYHPYSRASSARWINNHSNVARQGLWDFISDELKMKIPDNEQVRAQKLKYLKSKSYLHDIALRAEPYMYWIVEQIQKRDMPMELVLLPIVESAFDPHVTSHANAAGLWQIVPQTGRNYGLKQNQWYDGRRDVAASTTAALDILQRLNRMFDGDWLLTIAAYNSGEGRVLQAMKANRAKGLPTDFWSLSLPKETSVYVPRTLALSDIVRHHKKYGVKLPTPDEQRALARIEVGQQMELTQAADMAGMSLKTLKSFNPGYIRNVTAPNGPHYIMVPKSHAKKFKNSLAETEIAVIQNDRLDALSQEDDLKPAGKTRNSTYKVRRGDSLTVIAKRTNVKVGDLQRWNNLSPKNPLKAGQTLTLVKKNTGTNARSKKDSSITYKVRKGDSLYSIAKRHGVNIKDVLRWNNLIEKKTNIKPGLMLTLYVSKGSPSGS